MSSLIEAGALVYLFYFSLGALILCSLINSGERGGSTGCFKIEQSLPEKLLLARGFITVLGLPPRGLFFFKLAVLKLLINAGIGGARLLLLGFSYFIVFRGLRHSLYGFALHQTSEFYRDRPFIFLSIRSRCLGVLRIIT